MTRNSRRAVRGARQQFVQTTREAAAQLRELPEADAAVPIAPTR
jgi:hypothetical protein